MGGGGHQYRHRRHGGRLPARGVVDRQTEDVPKAWSPEAHDGHGEDVEEHEGDDAA